MMMSSSLTVFLIANNVEIMIVPTVIMERLETNICLQTATQSVIINGGSYVKDSKNSYLISSGDGTGSIVHGNATRRNTLISIDDSISAVGLTVEDRIDAC